MHGMPTNDGSTQINIKSNMDWRRADAMQIAEGLQDLRAKTLVVFDAYIAANCLTVPYANELNPPLWELGHIAWFQEYWIDRNQQREMGIHYDANHVRLPSILADADSLYDSGKVSHTSRWHLPLLEPETCKNYTAKTLSQTLNLLTQAGDSDDALYFYRLVMFHEAMHLEAAIYMAQNIGVNITPNLIANKSTNTLTKRQFKHEKQVFQLGNQNSGFVFDNELGQHAIEVDTFEIDSRCINWGEYLSFVEATNRKLPRYVQRGDTGF
ncbi:MAG: hypothetical protein RL535_543, partial [Pseudomonadota bacterium]